MKVFKFFTPILVCTLTTVSSSFSFVSCGNEPSIPNNVEQFISDRTFSLMAYSIVKKGTVDYYGAFCYGTGWIIDDATPYVQNDYKYHVATNWHVINGFHDLAEIDYDDKIYDHTIYNYADSSCADESGIIDSLHKYTSLHDGTDGYYTEEPNINTFLYEPYLNNKGIDLYEITINFASKDGDVGSTAMKAKLDRLNEYRKNHGYINTFVLGDSQSIWKKKKYIGGYPLKEKSDLFFGGKWETHMVNSGLHYVPFHDHSVGFDDIHDIVDHSPQYESTINMGDNWMAGGASGSMLVTEDCEICGIYWGGWASYGNKFYPSFSLFNVNNKNFLSNYIHSIF